MKINTKYIIYRLFIIILLASVISLFVPSIETFLEMSLATRDRCPTKNQSYNLRKDIVIPRKNWPFLNSSIGPLHPESCIFRP